MRASVRRGISTSSAVRTKGHLDTLLPASTRTAPIVAVQDAAPHTLAWLGSVYGAPVVPLGVEQYGQSGSLADTYAWHQLDADAIVNASLLALAETGA